MAAVAGKRERGGAAGLRDCGRGGTARLRGVLGCGRGGECGRGDCGGECGRGEGGGARDGRTTSVHAYTANI
jgi:hypothetical protein